MNCTKCLLPNELAKGKKWCKSCKNKYELERRKKYTKEKREKVNQLERERYEKKKKDIESKVTESKVTESKVTESKVTESKVTESKVCSICKKTKSLDMFYMAKSKGTIRAMCKSCSSLKRKEYYKKNSKEVCKQTSNYKKEKISNNPEFKLEVRLRTRIYQALIAQTIKKKCRTWKYIGCTSPFFQKWIEYQLYDGMTMENYGKLWHIDHVLCCASFDLSKEEEQLKCFNWKNLRPYLATKNNKKYTTHNVFELVLQELKVVTFLRYIRRSEKQPA